MHYVHATKEFLLASDVESKIGENGFWPRACKDVYIATTSRTYISLEYLTLCRDSGGDLI
jgi:hypothetical protein